MLICVMKNRLASYLDENFCFGNQHNSFCMIHLLWDPMVKKGGATVFVSSVCITIGSNGENSGGSIILLPTVAVANLYNINSCKILQLIKAQTT